jgi:hypothetical protein
MEKKLNIKLATETKSSKREFNSNLLEEIKSDYSKLNIKYNM